MVHSSKILDSLKVFLHDQAYKDMKIFFIVENNFRSSRSGVNL